MLRNYLKIALRNLVRNKVYSFINVFGLAIGIATCLVISLFVVDELSFDRFHAKADQIVRVTFGGVMSGEVMKEAGVMAPVAQSLKNDFPEVLEATRMQQKIENFKIIYKGKTFKENKMAAVDANFFQVFTLPFLKGDVKTALVEPNTLVITEETARRYFGNEDPIGKTLFFKNANSYKKVTGVIAEIPANSHFHFGIFSSMADVPEAKSTSYMSGTFYTYLVLPAGYDYRKLQAKLPLFVEKHMSDELKLSLGMTLKEFRKKGNDIGLNLQPLTDIHLRSDFTNNIEAGGNIRYVYIFGAIALFMLLIACINFMNLSTASASKRAKEVGIRKVLGSFQTDLIGQFLFESILLASIALLLALGLVQLLLPVFNGLADKNLSLPFASNPLLLAGLLAFGILVGILAGSYPAFFLSSFKPVAILKSRFTTSRKSIGLRSGLVVFQFFISIFLIVGTVVVSRQLAYIQNKRLGFEKEQILVVRNTDALGSREQVWKDKLLQDRRVVNVSNSGFLPVGSSYENRISTFPDGNSTQIRRTQVYQIDDRYIPTIGMKILAGRNFSKNFPTDSAGVIVNEAMAKLFGWGKNAVGHKVNYFKDNKGGTAQATVIGIVKDFHYKSLHEEIAPLMMVLSSTPGLIIKVKPTDVSGLLASLKTEWKTFNVEEPFSYSFLDEDFDKTYVAERKTSTILGIFAGLTIFIACLGLFGLATFTADQRTKEIGIRKVLGASAGQIVGLLSKDFMKLILIACAFAFPLSWYAMHQWLQDYAYRIDMGWWIFIASGILALAIALLTVSFQAVKAALANPVESLRSD